MTNNPQHHIDIAALQDLKDIMEDEFGNLVDTFIADSAAKVVELAEVIAAQDADGLRRTAHSLKGSSSNVCAGALSELARQLEMLGKEGKTEGADLLLKKLREEFEVVKSLLIQQC